MEIGEDSGPAPMEPLDRDFSVNAIGLVSRTFSLYVRRMASYMIIMGLAMAILYLVSAIILILLHGTYALMFLGFITHNPSNFVFQFFNLTGINEPVFSILGISLVVMVIGSILGGGVVSFALQDYGNRGAGDVGSSLSYAMSRATTIVSARFIVALVTIVPMLPGMIVLFMMTQSFGTPPMDPAFYQLIPAVMLILVIGIMISMYLSIRLLPTIGVVVAEEGASAIYALERAKELTGGHFWHVFGGDFLLTIVIGVITFTFNAIGVLLVFTYPIATVLIMMILSSIFEPINYIFNAVLYRDLESRFMRRVDQWW